MRYRELVEMPLADFQRHGDWSDSTTNLGPAETPGKNWQVGDQKAKNNSFASKVDRAMVRDISTETKLKQVFAKFDIDFYIYLVNSAAMALFHENLDWGELDLHIPEYDDDVDLVHPKDALGAKLYQTFEQRQKENAIQVVLTHNEGGRSRHPLTPWMIVHRMVHAFWKKVGGGGSGLAMNSAASLIRANYVTGDGSRDAMWRAEKGYPVADFLTKVCTFKSARDDNILKTNAGGGDPELYVDLFTQYIYTGKVTFRMPPESFHHDFYDDDDKNGRPRFKRQEFVLRQPWLADNIMHRLNVLARELETQYAADLKKLCGGTYIC